MPRLFMVRKKSSGSQKSWDDAEKPKQKPVTEVDQHSHSSPVPLEASEDRLSPLKHKDEHQESGEPATKKLCRAEGRTLINRPCPLRTEDLLKFSQDHHIHPCSPQNVSYTSPHELFRRDVFEFPQFHNVPMLPRFPTPLMWNPMLHPHPYPHSPPFMRVHPPPTQWLPSPPPTSSPLPTCTTWRRTPPVGKTPSPVGVLSPSEIPSPSALTVAEEPSSSNSASIPGGPGHVLDFSRHSDPQKALLPVPPPCFPIREPIPTYSKPTGLKVEVINNGFGIKNPMLTNDTPRQPEVRPVAQPSGYLMTSDVSHCSLCGFKSDSPRQLQKHLRSHKEIKRFLCTVCGKGFNDTFDLKRHTRTHTGVRPYKCEKCGKAFTQRCSLESHCKKIHGVKFEFAFNERRSKTYVCEECGHSTNDPEEHFVHLRTQHPNNPAILRCHDRRQFKFVRRKNSSGS